MRAVRSRMTVCGLVVVVALAAALVPGRGDAAEEAPEAEVEDAGSPAPEVERAKALLLSGKLVDALELLRRFTAEAPDDPDANFLLGMGALGALRGRTAPDGSEWTKEAVLAFHDEAVAAFKRVVDSQPGLARPRLELARALFERGRCQREVERVFEHFFGDDCDAAERQFRRAIAGDVPEAVVGNVNQFIGIIRARRRLTGHFEVALAPDSNVNSASSVDCIFIPAFPGLCFRLSEESAATSGLGVTVSAAADYDHPLTVGQRPGLRPSLRLGGGLYRKEYAGSRFDDMIVSVRAGPRVRTGRAEAGVTARAERRWTGDDLAHDAVGVGLEAGRALGRRAWLSGGLQWMDHRHPDDRAQHDGPRLAVNVGANVVLTPAVRAGLNAGWSEVRSQRATDRNATRTFGASLRFDLPPVFGVRGFGVDLSETLQLTGYEAANVSVHPDPRKDRLLISRASLHNRKLDFGGFTPTLSFVNERRSSNIAHLEYRRNRLEFALQRTF